MGRREAIDDDEDLLDDDAAPISDEAGEDVASDEDADRDDQDGDQADGDDSSGGIDDIPDDDSDEDDELPRAIRTCSRCGIRGYHTGRCARCAAASRIHDELRARAAVTATKAAGATKAVDAMMTKRVVTEATTTNATTKKATTKAQPAAAKSPARPAAKPQAMKMAPKATKPQRVNSPAPVGPAAPDATGPVCAKCKVSPVGRVVEGCKNNNFCPACRRRARVMDRYFTQRDAARGKALKKKPTVKKPSAKKPQSATALKPEQSKPATPPPVVPSEEPDRLVATREAIAGAGAFLGSAFRALEMVETIGWPTVEALVARVTR